MSGAYTIWVYRQDGSLSDIVYLNGKRDAKREATSWLARGFRVALKSGHVEP